MEINVNLLLTLKPGMLKVTVNGCIDSAHKGVWKSLHQLYTHNGSKLKLAFDLDIGNVYVKVNNNGCRKKELSSMDLDTTAKQKTFTWMDGQTADRTDRHHYFSDRVSLCILWKKGSAHCEQFVTNSKVRTLHILLIYKHCGITE